MPLIVRGFLQSGANFDGRITHQAAPPASSYVRNKVATHMRCCISRIGAKASVTEAMRRRTSQQPVRFWPKPEHRRMAG